MSFKRPRARVTADITNGQQVHDVRVIVDDVPVGRVKSVTFGAQEGATICCTVDPGGGVTAAQVCALLDDGFSVRVDNYRHRGVTARQVDGTTIYHLPDLDGGARVISAVPTWAVEAAGALVPGVTKVLATLDDPDGCYQQVHFDVEGGLRPSVEQVDDLLRSGFSLRFTCKTPKES